MRKTLVCTETGEITQNKMNIGHTNKIQTLDISSTELTGS